MDAVTANLHDFIPQIFTIMKARNKGQYDVAKHLLFGIHEQVDMLIKAINQEHREAIERGELQC